MRDDEVIARRCYVRRGIPYSSCEEEDAPHVNFFRRNPRGGGAGEILATISPVGEIRIRFGEEKRDSDGVVERGIGCSRWKLSDRADASITRNELG